MTEDITEAVRRAEDLPPTWMEFPSMHPCLPHQLVPQYLSFEEYFIFEAYLEAAFVSEGWVALTHESLKVRAEHAFDESVAAAQVRAENAQNTRDFQRKTSGLRGLWNWLRQKPKPVLTLIEVRYAPRNSVPPPSVPEVERAISRLLENGILRLVAESKQGKIVREDLYPTPELVRLLGELREVV